MSSFIVSSACINSIVTFLEHHNGYFGWLKREYGFDVTEPNDRSRLAESLYRLNCAAVDERYGEGTAEKDEATKLLFVYRRVIRRDVAVFKAARCLLYQCSEGSVTEQPLFKALHTIASVIAHGIIEALPEYDAASWGD